MAVGSVSGAADRAAAERGMLFRCLSGSRAYGTANADSDTDVRGVFAAPPRSVMTPFFPLDEADFGGDDRAFELTKWARLMSQQNPNIVELLWTDGESVLFEHPAWAPLRAARAELLTRRVRHTFGGYAASQLRKMRGHERWIANPQPEDPPRPRDFLRVVHDLSPGRAMREGPPRDGRWALVDCGQDLLLLFPDPEGGHWHDADGGLRATPRAERPDLMRSPPAAVLRWDRAAYEGRKRDHANYWAWRRDRNPARAAAEARLGYDAKNAAHLVRLLRMAVEILSEGVVRVRRPDAAELREIRNGGWPYERVIAEAERLEAELPGLEARSGLPEEIDRDRFAGLVQDVYARAWGIEPEVFPAATPEPPRPAPPPAPGPASAP